MVMVNRRTILLDSIEFYSSRYELYQQFDRGGSMSNFIYALARALAWIIHLLNLGSQLRSTIGKAINLNPIDSGYIGLVLSDNQARIAEQIDCIVETPITWLSVGTNCQLQNAIRISNLQVFLFSMSNYGFWKDVGKVYNQSVALKENAVRVAKLAGLEGIIEAFISKANFHSYISMNDHSFYSNYLLGFVKSKYGGIRSIYIQHAPVSSSFPALKHDVNVIFSKDSREKYKNPDGYSIYELFDLRFYSQLKNQRHVFKGVPKKILLCPNQLDDVGVTLSIYYTFIEKGLDVLIRKHPADGREAWIEKTKSHQVKFSTSTLIWDDLEWSDAVITNESAVALEAIFCGKLFYKADFMGGYLDNYGFVEKGLVTRTFADLMSLVINVLGGELCYNQEMLSYFIGNLSNHQELTKQLNNEVFYI